MAMALPLCPSLCLPLPHSIHPLPNIHTQSPLEDDGITRVRVIVPVALDGVEALSLLLQAAPSKRVSLSSALRSPPTIAPSQGLTHAPHTSSTYTQTQAKKQERARAAATRSSFPPPPSLFTDSAFTALKHCQQQAAAVYFQAAIPWRITGTTMTRYVRLERLGVGGAFLVL